MILNLTSSARKFSNESYSDFNRKKKGIFLKLNERHSFLT